MNKIFEKPFTPKTQKDHLFIPPQVNTYRDSLNQDKKIYNYTAQKYIENIYRVQTFLNHNPRATEIKEPNTNYSIITQKPLTYNFDDLKEFEMHIDELLEKQYIGIIFSFSFLSRVFISVWVFSKFSSVFSFSLISIGGARNLIG